MWRGVAGGGESESVKERSEERGAGGDERRGEKGEVKVCEGGSGRVRG
jgi:hypothetical protein